MLCFVLYTNIWTCLHSHDHTQVMAACVKVIWSFVIELTERKTAEYGKFAGDRLSRSSYCYPTEVLLRFCRADTSHFKLLWFRGLHNKKSPKSGASILQRGHQVCCGLKEATHGSHKLPRHESNIHHSGWGIYGFISHQIAATLKKFSNHVWRYYWTRRCHHYTVYSTFKPPSF